MILSRRIRPTDRDKEAELSVVVEVPNLAAISEVGIVEVISSPETEVQHLAVSSKETDLRSVVASRVAQDLSAGEAVTSVVLAFKG